MSVGQKVKVKFGNRKFREYAREVVGIKGGCAYFWARGVLLGVPLELCEEV